MLFKTLDDMTILLQNSQIDIYEYFQTNHGLVKLKVNDIMYFEYSERKINLYTNSDSIYQFYDTIYKLEERFKQYHFISPHKAFFSQYRLYSKHPFERFNFRKRYNYTHF